MKKMQRATPKFLAGLIILTIFIFQPAFSQTSSFRLKTADSLFRAKQYTQSFDHYEQILKQDQYTPAMLLKMAFIQEGLLHTGQALYYLNLYYLVTRDKTTLEKMNELAAKYNLEGYESTDNENIAAFYHEYKTYFTMAFAAILLFVFTTVLYTKVKLHRRPVIGFTVFCVLTLAFAGHLYYDDTLSTAIITQPATYVMTGPSAGASVLEIIGDGHRVSVVGHHDVWFKVQWAGNVGYIKENSLVPVKL